MYDKIKLKQCFYFTVSANFGPLSSAAKKWFLLCYYEALIPCAVIAAPHQRKCNKRVSHFNRIVKYAANTLNQRGRLILNEGHTKSMRM